MADIFDELREKLDKRYALSGDLEDTRVRLNQVSLDLEAVLDDLDGRLGEDDTPSQVLVVGLRHVFDSRNVHLDPNGNWVGARPHVESGGRISMVEPNTFTFRTNGGRAEFQGIHTAKMDSTVLYKWTMRYERERVFQRTGTWRIVGQFHKGSGHPPLSVQIDENPRRIKLIQYLGAKFDQVWTGDFGENADRDIELSLLARWSLGPTGRLDLRMNGTSIFESSGPNTYGGASQAYPKFGAYDGGSGDTEVTFRNIRVWEADGFDERLHDAV